MSALEGRYGVYSRSNRQNRIRGPDATTMGARVGGFREFTEVSEHGGGMCASVLGSRNPTMYTGLGARRV